MRFKEPADFGDKQADFNGGASLSTINATDLEAALTGNPEALDVHLTLVEQDVEIAGHSVKIHYHCLAVNSNGRIELHRLAEFMRNAAADYALPRSKVAEAKARDAKFNSIEATAELIERAKRSFTDLAKTGEGGEMLLFVLAERFIKLPQILCKMDLKTDNRLHYHGADGVYAGVTADGALKLYWESKIYEKVGDGIRACLKSLAPYLIEPEHEGAEWERDLLLLSDKADLSGPTLTAALRKYFDRSSPQSNRVRYCGLASWASQFRFTLKRMPRPWRTRSRKLHVRRSSTGSRISARVLPRTSSKA